LRELRELRQRRQINCVLIDLFQDRKRRWRDIVCQGINFIDNDVLRVDIDIPDSMSHLGLHI